ncbi:hypothetical protein NA63_2692 [Flavobacteriaceae bacterium MAR_2010_105]|nr:hypothetical protein NA63_2692 [Flavobacteriaceae bacterium MAR_2010_105]
MKFKILLFASLLTLSSCKDKKTENVDYKTQELDVTTSVYPESITKVFEAHGGIDRWKQMKTLSFTMPKAEGNEVTTTDLKSRKAVIDMPHHQLGFDGQEVWLKKKDTTTYKGNPRFYYNLMFYFYAMPFVLSDDGIIYTDVEPLVVEGTSYPGIKISYESGVGESPEDEYILYYDQDSNMMAWLGYTVTYFTKEKSKEFHYIKYANWQEQNGLLLPETLEWYTVENNLPISKVNEVVFMDVQLSTDPKEDTKYKKPEAAEVIK